VEEEIRRPGHASLRRFRTSRPEANYFITVKLEGRGTGLDQPSMTTRIFEEWHRLGAEQTWSLLAGVVMPDHIHLLIQLGQRHALTEAMRLFRGRLSPDLLILYLRWQKAFYEHRLRSPQDITPVIFYIYLNPYRAGLLSQKDMWPGYYCRSEEWEWLR
jgi:REP element-mobilizing transposase RayT